MIRKEGVAAAGRHLHGVEDRAEVGLGEEGHVGVPPPAEVQEVVRFRDHVEHLREVPIALHEGMGVEIAEAAAERHLLFGGEVLVAKHQHAMREEGLMDLLDGGVGEVGQIDVGHLGANNSRQRPDGEGHGTVILPVVDGVGPIW